MSLIIFILATFGASNAIVYEQVFQWLRDIKFLTPLTTCITCTGFYIGCALYFLLPLTLPIYLNIFIAGLIGSATNKIIQLILLKF